MRKVILILLLSITTTAQKRVLITYVDPSGTVTDNSVSADQSKWLRKQFHDRKLTITLVSERRDADYFIFWTQAEGSRSFISVVPHAETTTGSFIVTGNSFWFGTVTATRRYSTVETYNQSYLDVSMVIYDRQGRNVYETYHRGNYRWSKPDKDCLADSMKWLEQLLK